LEKWFMNKRHGTENWLRLVDFDESWSRRFSGAGSSAWSYSDGGVGAAVCAVVAARIFS
jgi:hypothetical protein